MAKYEVLAGVHFDEAGKAHTKGMHVESKTDLRQNFAEKFRLVGEEPPPKPAQAQTLDAPPVMVSQEPLQPQPTGKATPATLDLAARANTALPAQAGQHTTDVPPVNTAEDDDEGDDIEEASPAQVAAGTPAGRNVTPSFKKVEEQDYRVYKTADGYFVYDDDDLTKPVNPVAVTKPAVQGLVDADLAKKKSTAK